MTAKTAERMGRTTRVAWIAFAVATGCVATAQSRPAASPVMSAGTPSRVAVAPAPQVVGEEEDVDDGSGIKVHGHWVLELKNADGTTAERREFENSLVTSSASGNVTGSSLIAALLSGTVTAADPSVAFIQVAAGATVTDPAQSCNLFGIVPAGVSCYLLSSTNSIIGGKNAPIATGFVPLPSQLGLSSTVNFSPTVSLVLSGNFTVPSGMTSVAQVQTISSFCVPLSATGGSGAYLAPDAQNNSIAFANSSNFRTADAASGSCSPAKIPATDAGYGGTLTATPVPGGPMSVVPGQIIAVTVTISFS